MWKVSSREIPLEKEALFLQGTANNITVIIFSSAGISTTSRKSFSSPLFNLLQWISVREKHQPIPCSQPHFSYDDSIVGDKLNIQYFRIGSLSKLSTRKEGASKAQTGQRFQSKNHSINFCCGSWIHKDPNSIYY